jgi:hypothetical protein
VTCTLKDLFSNPWFYVVSAVLSWFPYQVVPAILHGRQNKQLENYRRELLRRDKAEAITDLIIYLRKNELTETEKDIVDKLLLNLCLCLPPCLIHKLAHTVCRSGKPEDLKPLGLFVEIKEFFDGSYKADRKRRLTGDNIPLTKRDKPLNHPDPTPSISP